ncbi:neutral amino acid permease protein [Diplodia corticola]|uniref:Neutral amino acid permease protein n=1 Tax=Diplodia corticola TaxID=236234 RepID=A0A1J9QWE2_9PEZI|nr:neutral amino acid permease protein [Diplodia corticola]OJD32322.1 neutral amino acid permease protein [Diplodia corticola]
MDEDAGAANVKRALGIAIEKYNKVTGEDIKLDNKMTVAEMTADMKKIDSGRLEGQRTEIFKNTMETLVSLGSVAAEAASMVFPSATLCYQVLRPIIDTAETYRKYYRTEVLFETLNSLAAILKRVTVYLDGARRGAQIDNALENTIVQLLSHFVTICAIYAKVKKEHETIGGRVVHYLKAAVHYDGGITKEFDEIKKLEAEEWQNNSVQTRTVTTITGNFLQADRNDKIQARHRSVIKGKLPFNEESPAWNSWCTAHEKLRKGFLHGHGAWFFKDDAFRAWIDVGMGSNSFKPVFVLHGRSGSGKSLLCSEVIQYLHQNFKKKQERINSMPRASIAYFYFGKADATRAPKAEEKDRTRKKEPTMDDALNAILWQLAESDTSYQSFVHGQCDTSPAFSTASERWDSLVTSYAEPKASKTRKVFFIVIDGIDQSGDKTRHEAEDTLRVIMDKVAGLRDKQVQVRLFLTCNSKSLKRFRETDKGDAVQFFLLKSLENAQDVQEMVKSKIKELSETRGMVPERQQLLHNLEIKLCKSYTAEPSIVRAVLERMSRLQRNRDYKEILESDWDDRKTIIRWQTEALNGEMGDEQIEDLNDFMACIASLQVWPSLEQLRTFILLRTGKSPEMPLQTQIEGTYSRLFEIEIPEDEIIVSYEMMYYLFDEEQPFEGVDAPRSVSMVPDKLQDGPSNQLSEAEINLMEGLVRSNYGVDAFKRFGFDEHFNHIRRKQLRLPQPRPRIGFQAAESHVRIIIRLLKAVSDPEYRNEAESLHEYTAKYLFFHLEMVQDIDQIDGNTRREIGRNLHQFFHDEAAVENWLEKAPSSDSQEWCESFDHVLRWFEDVEVSAGASCSTGSDTSASIDAHDLLAVPRKILASHWLQKNTWNAKVAHTWFRDLVEKISQTHEPITQGTDEPAPAESTVKPEQEKNPSNSQEELPAQVDAEAVKEHPEQTAETPSSVEYRIMDLAHHASNLLHVSSSDGEDFIWHLRIGETLQEHSLSSAAEKSCDKAIKLLDNTSNKPDDEWRVYWCLVQASPNNIAKGVENLEKLLERLKNQKYMKTHPAEMQNMVKALWELHNDSWGRPRDAMRACHRLLEGNADKSWLMDQAWALIHSDRTEDAAGFLHDISGTPVGGGPSPLTTLFHHYASSKAFHDTIARILKLEKGLLVKAYLDSIHAAGSDARLQVFLRHYYGVALAYQDGADEACIIWEKSLFDSSVLTLDQVGNGEIYNTRVQTLQGLLTEYLQIAQEKSGKDQAVGLPERLEKVRHWVTQELGPIGDSDHPVVLLLARAYHLVGKRRLAKECMQGFVKTALELLSDETTDNDWEGLVFLTQAAAAIDEDGFALAAWKLASPGTTGHLWCDGGCGRLDLQSMDLLSCKDCIDVQFERSCYDQLQNGKLDRRVCGQTHEFLTLPKMDPKAFKQMERGSMHEDAIKDVYHAAEHLFGVRVPAVENLARPEPTRFQYMKLRVQVAGSHLRWKITQKRKEKRE